MKKTMIALTAAVSIFALSACNNSADDSEVLVETSAGSITKEELYSAMKDQAGAAILRDLVYTKVLSEKFEVSDKEVDKKYEEMQAQLGAQFDAIVQQNGEEFVREILRSDLLKEKAAMEEIEVKEGEVIKASHILVKVTEESTDEEKKAAEAKIKEVQEKLAAGGDFSELAKEYSEDGSAANGGDLGWFTKGQMVPAFEEAAFALKKDEVSEIVKSDFGYHIIKATGTTDNFDEMKEEEKNEIRSALLQTNQDAIQKALDKAIENADVKVKDKDFEDLFQNEAAQG
ncbi:peptidylprolyl isomerase [Fredinandcohnia humi]